MIWWCLHEWITTCVTRVVNLVRLWWHCVWNRCWILGGWFDASAVCTFPFTCAIYALERARNIVVFAVGVVVVIVVVMVLNLNTLRFVTAILEPDFNLRRCQMQHLRQLFTFRRRYVTLLAKPTLQFEHLSLWEQNAWLTLRPMFAILSQFAVRRWDDWLAGRICIG